MTYPVPISLSVIGSFGLYLAIEMIAKEKLQILKNLGFMVLSGFIGGSVSDKVFGSSIAVILLFVFLELFV